MSHSTRPELVSFTYFLQGQNLHDQTIRQHLERIRIILAFCEPFCAEEMQRFLGHLHQKKVSGSTMNKYIQAVKKYGKFIGLTWTEAFTKVKETTKPRILLTEEEIEGFIQIAPLSNKYSLFFALVAYTGARPSEIAHLTAADIDFATGSLIFTESKTGEGRIVPIPESLKQPLQDYIQGFMEGYLFTAQTGHNIPISPASWKKAFDKRCALLGIKKHAKPYSLRHSFISRMSIDAEIPIKIVQSFAGHKKVETTMRYTHFSFKAMQKALKKDPLQLKFTTAQERFQYSVDLLFQSGVHQDERFQFELTQHSIRLEMKEFC